MSENTNNKNVKTKASKAFYSIVSSETVKAMAQGQSIDPVKLVKKCPELVAGSYRMKLEYLDPSDVADVKGYEIDIDEI